MDGRMDGRTDGWMDVRMNRWTDGQMDLWIEHHGMRVRKTNVSDGNTISNKTPVNSSG